MSKDAFRGSKEPIRTAFVLRRNLLERGMMLMRTICYKGVVVRIYRFRILRLGRRRHPGQRDPGQSRHARWLWATSRRVEVIETAIGWPALETAHQKH